MRKWNDQLSVWEYEAGDTVWYIPGYSDNYLIAIKCQIKHVDNYYRKLNPRAKLFYWLDEPVGHAVTEDELFASRQTAIAELKVREAEHKQFAFEEFAPTLLESFVANLGCYREEASGNIYKSWVRAGHVDQCTDTLRSRIPYPKKNKGVDWFPGVFYKERL